MRDGIRAPVVLFASDTGHYCKYSIAGWLGMGTSSLVTIPTNDANEMNLDVLAQAEMRAAACRQANRRHHRDDGHHRRLRAGQPGSDRSPMR
ncbi:MAG: hypothetical protein U0736_22345 [Gemmataceae bacterium]